MDNREQRKRPVLAQSADEVLLEDGHASPVTSLGSVEGDSLEIVPTLQPVSKPESRIVCFEVQNPATVEFGLLAARLQTLKAQNRMKRILVAGCGFGSGSSLISANLAIVLAQDPSHRVLLVDANLERPSLSNMFGIKTEKGLSDHLQTGEPFENLVCQLSPGRIWFLPAGPRPRSGDEQGQIYHSQRLADLVQLETDWFDWVVVDPPALETWLAVRAVAQLCDGIIIVVRNGHTQKKVLRRALDLLEGLPVVGFVWNA